MSERSEAAFDLLERGRGDDAVRALEDGCGVGDADSLFALATWYLSGTVVGRDRAEAQGLLCAATEAGQVDAALMEIALTGNGAFGAPDWAGARALLRTAARTDPAAEAQMRLLDSMDLSTDGAPASIPKGEPLCASPRARLFAGLVTPAECAHLMSAARPIMEPSFVVDPATGQQRAHPIRTSDGTVLGPAREDLVVRAVAARLAAVSGTDVSEGETFSVLRYVPGQEYRMHLDALPSAANQRVKTMIIYLNDGYQGGETMFAANGLKVAGRTGDVLLFDNILPDGRPDPASRHAGLPVTAGEKWVATRWIRARPYDPWSWRPGE